jgi:hypothetical protein
MAAPALWDPDQKSDTSSDGTQNVRQRLTPIQASIHVESSRGHAEGSYEFDPAGSGESLDGVRIGVYCDG